MPKVRIEMTKHARGKVWLDDREIDNVRGVYFSAAVNEANCVLIHLVAQEIEIVSEETEIETKDVQRNCIVCGEPATEFVKNDMWKKYINEPMSVYCEKCVQK